MTTYELASIEMQARFKRLEEVGAPMELIRDMYERHVKEMAIPRNQALIDVFNLADQMEIRLGANIKTQLGMTNGMLADLREEYRVGREEERAADTELRREFRDGLDAIGERLTGVEATVDEHSLDIASFKRSRQQSIDERRDLQAAITELREGREENHNATLAVGAQVETLAQTVQQILARITRDDEATA